MAVELGLSVTRPLEPEGTRIAVGLDKSRHAIPDRPRVTATGAAEEALLDPEQVAVAGAPKGNHYRPPIDGGVRAGTPVCHLANWTQVVSGFSLWWRRYPRIVSVVESALLASWAWRRRGCPGAAQEQAAEHGVGAGHAVDLDHDRAPAPTLTGKCIQAPALKLVVIATVLVVVPSVTITVLAAPGRRVPVERVQVEGARVGRGERQPDPDLVVVGERPWPAAPTRRAPGAPGRRSSARPRSPGPPARARSRPGAWRRGRPPTRSRRRRRSPRGRRC